MHRMAKLLIRCAGRLAAAMFILGAPGFARPASALEVRYGCQGGASMLAHFDNDSDMLLLEMPGGLHYRLKRAVSGSGMRYVGGTTEFFGKADEALLQRAGKPDLRCNANANAAQGAAASGADTGPSFRCAGPLNRTETRICANGRLAGLDARMAGLYEGLLKNMSAGARSDLKQAQRGWLGQRNGCGVDDACIEARYRSRVAALESFAAPASPQPPPAAPGRAGFPHPAQSWGGVVRSGPGMQFKRVGSLKLGAPVTLLADTGVSMNGYNWFRIGYRGGAAYQWGGVLCAKGGPVPGAFQVCD